MTDLTELFEQAGAGPVRFDHRDIERRYRRRRRTRVMAAAAATVAVAAIGLVAFDDPAPQLVQSADTSHEAVLAVVQSAFDRTRAEGTVIYEIATDFSYSGEGTTTTPAEPSSDPGITVVLTDFANHTAALLAPAPDSSSGTRAGRQDPDLIVDGQPYPTPDLEPFLIRTLDTCYVRFWTNDPWYRQPSSAFDPLDGMLNTIKAPGATLRKTGPATIEAVVPARSLDSATPEATTRMTVQIDDQGRLASITTVTDDITVSDEPRTVVTSTVTTTFDRYGPQLDLNPPTDGNTQPVPDDLTGGKRVALENYCGT